MNYSDPSQSMTSENVDEFEVWVFDASDFVVSVIPIQAPWDTNYENYSLDNSSA